MPACSRGPAPTPDTGFTIAMVPGPDPRPLARFNGTKGQWRIEPGTYIVALSRSAGEPVKTGRAELKERWFGR